VQPHPQRRDEEAAAEADRRGEHGLSRTGPLQHLPNTAADSPRNNMARLKIQPRVVRFPIRRRRRCDPDDPRERQVKNTEGVRLADRQVDGQGRRRHEPAVVTGPRHGPRPVEEAKERDRRLSLEIGHDFPDCAGMTQVSSPVFYGGNGGGGVSPHIDWIPRKSRVDARHPV